MRSRLPACVLQPHHSIRCRCRRLASEQPWRGGRGEAVGIGEGCPLTATGPPLPSPRPPADRVARHGPVTSRRLLEEQHVNTGRRRVGQRGGPGQAEPCSTHGRTRTTPRRRTKEHPRPPLEPVYHGLRGPKCRQRVYSRE